MVIFWVQLSTNSAANSLKLQAIFIIQFASSSYLESSCWGIHASFALPSFIEYQEPEKIFLTLSNLNMYLLHIYFRVYPHLICNATHALPKKKEESNKDITTTTIIIIIFIINQQHHYQHHWHVHIKCISKSIVLLLVGYKVSCIAVYKEVNRIIPEVLLPLSVQRSVFKSYFIFSVLVNLQTF